MERREISLDESKQILLEIFKFVDQFCRNNNIKYSLGEGTLLGAVRHRGFIPWDDDIDILMSRKDMERFLQLYKDGPYKVFHENNKENYWNCVARITDPNTEVYFGDNNFSTHGLWIALTPYDVKTPNESKWTLQKKFIARMVRICRMKNGIVGKGKGIKKMIRSVYLHFCSISFLNRWFKRIMTFYANEPSCEVFKLNYYYEPNIYPSSWFADYTELEFEGVKSMAIAHYHEYLTAMYGDYMQLPPIEERVPKHNFRMFYKDK